MFHPDTPRVPPPLPREEPLRPRKRRTPEYPEPNFEVRDIETRDLRFGLTSIPRTEVKPGIEGQNEDRVEFYPDESMATVFDGAGGYSAGETASLRARDTLPVELATARLENAELDEDQRAALWNELIESSVLIRADDAKDQPQTLGKRREEALRAIREQLERTNPPQAVKEEAAAIYRALQGVSGTIFQESDRQPELKEMQTTAVGMRFMEATGRRFAIFFGVGDSEAYLEHEDPQHPGSRITERAIPSDNLLEVLLAYGNPGAEQAAETGDFSDPFIRQARFAASAQLLGQPTPPTPRLRIWEIREGDHFLLASDGLTDSDMTRDYLDTLTEVGAWKRKIRTMGERAIKGFRKKEGKAGVDDISIVAGEIKPGPKRTEIVPEHDLLWSALVGEILDKEGARGEERTDLEQLLLSEKVQQKIAQVAHEEITQRGLTDDLAVTGVLRKHTMRYMVDSRLERARRNIKSADQSTSDRAAE